MIHNLWGKITGNDQILARHSVRVLDKLTELKEKKVALVGNARSLTEQNYGHQIDDADIVVRINGAPIADSISHGTRTDWLAISVPITKQRLRELNPKLTIWMTPKRKNFPLHLSRSSSLAFYPKSSHIALSKALGSRPTTGAMAIDLIMFSDAKKLELFGFDFFSSRSLSGSRKKEDVPHDFAREKEWVAALAAADNRLILHR